MNVSDELRRIREKRLDITAAEMARKLGYKTASGYQAWENVTRWENKKFPDRFVAKLLRNIVGQGQPPIDSREILRLGEISSLYIKGTQYPILLSGIQEVPISSIDRAAAPIIMPEQVEMFSTARAYPKDKGNYLQSDKKFGPRIFRLVVTNRSMEPTFSEGDELLCDPDAKVEPGDYVVAKLDREIAATVRQYRVRGYDGEGVPVVDLVPANPNFPPIALGANNPGKIYATVVGYFRALK